MKAKQPAPQPQPQPAVTGIEIAEEPQPIEIEIVKEPELPALPTPDEIQAELDPLTQGATFPVYHFWLPTDQDHIFTVNPAERIREPILPQDFSAIADLCAAIRFDLATMTGEIKSHAGRQKVEYFFKGEFTRHRWDVRFA